MFLNIFCCCSTLECRQCLHPKKSRLRWSPPTALSWPFRQHRWSEGALLWPPFCAARIVTTDAFRLRYHHPTYVPLTTAAETRRMAVTILFSALGRAQKSGQTSSCFNLVEARLLYKQASPPCLQTDKYRPQLLPPGTRAAPVGVSSLLSTHSFKRGKSTYASTDMAPTSGSDPTPSPGIRQVVGESDLYGVTAQSDVYCTELLHTCSFFWLQ